MEYAKPIVAERNGQELEYREEASPTRDLLQCLGILCNMEVAILGGSDDPTQEGKSAPIGSLYVCTNGKWYRKVGNSNTEWQEIQSGGGGGSQYLKDLLDVDDNLAPEPYNALMYDGSEWTAKPICHPQHDFGSITQPVDCGHYDMGFIS